MNNLEEALKDPKYISHKKEDRYTIDGKGLWQLFYYPIFECNKTKEVYSEPRALMIDRSKEGTWTKEIPLRYIDKVIVNIHENKKENNGKERKHINNRRTIQ